MEAAEFKSRLYENLRSSGFTDKLRLRSRLVEEIRLRTHAFLQGQRLQQQHRNEQAPSVSRSNQQSSVYDMAIDSLIWQWFQWRNYEFSLSVFAPESGLTEHQRMKGEDVLQLYHLQDHFVCLLDKPEHGKLRDIDYEFDTKYSMDRQANQMLLEEKMTAYQNECDNRMLLEVQRQVDRFKEQEVERITEQARRQHQQDIENQRIKFESDYAQKQRRLKEQEDEMREQFKRRQADFDREVFKDRQRLLMELDAVKAKEDALRRETELSQRSLKLEEERCARRLEEAQAKMLEAERTRESFDARFREQVQKYQLQFDKEHSHLLVQLKTQMAKLETERAVISERQKAWDSTSSQFNTTRADLDRLKQENTVLISDLSVLRKENEVLKGSNLQLQQALELVNQKSQMSQLSIEQDLALTKREKTEIEAELTRKKAELEKAGKDAVKFKKCAIHWQSESRDLMMRLEQLNTQYESVLIKYDDAVLKNKELEREVSSVRILLHHTQTALSNETTAARASSVLRERNYDDAEEFDRSASAISRLKKSVQRSQKGSEYQTDLRNTSRLIPVPALDLFDKPKSIFSESVKENNAPLKIEDLEQPIGQTIGSESEVTQIRRMIFEDQLPWEAPTALIKTEAPAVLSVKTSETIDAYDLRADTSVKVKEPAAVSANTNDASSGTNHQKETISSNAMEPIDASNPKNDDYHTISTQSPVSALNPYVSAEQSEGQESFEGSEIASIPADRDDLYAESKEAIEPKSVTVDEFAAIEAEPELQKYLRIAAANKQHHQTTSFDDDNDNEQRPAEPVKSANDAYANLDDFEGATESSGMSVPPEDPYQPDEW